MHFVLCTFPGGGYVHFEIDTLDTITLLENGGYLVIVSAVLGYLVIVSRVLREKCYGVQSMGYRVIVSMILKAIMDIVWNPGLSIVKNQILYHGFIYNRGALCYSWSITTGQRPERKKT